jgi:predicted transcriptional regulator
MGIKSYIGKRVKSKKGSTEKIKVSDYMTTKLITFKPDQSVMEVMNTLIKKRISGGPVVNDDYELIGIISETDCIKQINDSKYHNHPMGKINVEDHMNSNVDTIDSNMNVFDAADKFLKSHRRRFPVLKEGKLVGQISQMDILKAAINLKGTTWK